MAKAQMASNETGVWVWVLDVVHAAWSHPTIARFRGGVVASVGLAALIALASYHSADPSWNTASGERVRNVLGALGANTADAGMQALGLMAWLGAVMMVLSGLWRVMDRHPEGSRRRLRIRALNGLLAMTCLAGALSALSPPSVWPLGGGLGGLWGDGVVGLISGLFHFIRIPAARVVAGSLLAIGGAVALHYALAIRVQDYLQTLQGLSGAFRHSPRAPMPAAKVKTPRVRRTPMREETADRAIEPQIEPVVAGLNKPKASPREVRENQKTFDFAQPGGFVLPELAMLAKPKPRAAQFDEGALKQNARMLEAVLAEFGVRGQIDQIRPGPVVTLYELVPAAGVKSSRVVSLADDIARNMSVASARIAVVAGRNAIGIELPNSKRETVFLRDLLSSNEYEKQSQTLPMALGETIGGEPYIADLAKMPHLLIAGTTGSGKSVGVNAMILSILYRLPPEKVRFIMIDPKMLELSVYDGIPHLLAPVVTDPKKAVVALKWTVREMEDRYRRMSKIGVRNVAGFNERVAEAAAKGEHFERTVQTGFNEDGRPTFETEKIRPEPMPMLVVVIDEVADLMMVAGKDIEGAVQRLAQMARAAGIHLIMATQRPSVDVITGTIKANFPTRISFQVTSKIDARTIMQEQGAEQLLGQGDMLYMAGGGRITRLHGPFVSDSEVEAVANYLRTQGVPQYLEDVTAGGEDEEGGDVESAFAGEGGANDLYDNAVAVVTRDRKASTSYIQRRLQIGYNRAASLMERMEREGVVGQANHAGKREILAPPPP
jgi:S-DNA-T family DNA segregation ATPase FtsK/SpoIIIE